MKTLSEAYLKLIRDSNKSDANLELIGVNMNDNLNTIMESPELVKFISFLAQNMISDSTKYLTSPIDFKAFFCSSISGFVSMGIMLGQEMEKGE